MTEMQKFDKENARPVGMDTLESLAQTRGSTCPNERAVETMSNSSPRPKAREGAKANATEAGLAPGTVVMTMDGAIPVEFLNPGDRIITRRGVRKLKAIMRHTLPEGAKRIVVSAEALGGKPAKDVTLFPGQRIVVRDWRARRCGARTSPRLRSRALSMVNTSVPKQGESRSCCRSISVLLKFYMLTGLSWLRPTNPV